MSWDGNRPTIEDNLSNVPTIVQGNFEAIQDAMSAEHAGIGDTTASSGSHCSGGAGFLYEGSTTSITILSSPGSGALAYDTTLGSLKRYWSSSWNPVSSASWSRARWYLETSAQLNSVDGGSESQGLSFTGKSYDTLSEYNSAAGTWVATADGYYLVIGSVTLNNSGTRGTTFASGCSATSDITRKWSVVKNLNQTLYPTSTSDTWPTIVGASTCHEAVDDVVLNTGDYIRTGTGSDELEMAVSPVAASLLTAASIYSVVVSGYVGESGALGNNDPAFTINRSGTRYSKDVADEGWTSAEWTTDPSTSAAWTSAGVLACTGIGAEGFGWLGYGYGYIYALKMLIYTNSNTNYELIRETTADDSTYVELSAGAGNYFSPDVYGITSPVTNPTAQTQNITVSLSARLKASTANAITAASCLRVDTNNLSGADTVTKVISSTSFATYEWTYSQNPATSAAWTPTQIKGTAASNNLTGFGLQIISSSPTTTSADMSQCYLSVGWVNTEPYAQLDLIRIPTGGASAVSRSVVQKMAEAGVYEEESVRLMSVLPLSAGDKLGFVITKTANDDTVLSGEGISYFCVHRLGVDCL